MTPWLRFLLLILSGTRRRAQKWKWRLVPSASVRIKRQSRKDVGVIVWRTRVGRIEFLTSITFHYVDVTHTHTHTHTARHFLLAGDFCFVSGFIFMKRPMLSIGWQMRRENVTRKDQLWHLTPVPFPSPCHSRHLFIVALSLRWVPVSYHMAGNRIAVHVSLESKRNENEHMTFLFSDQCHTKFLFTSNFSWACNSAVVGT